MDDKWLRTLTSDRHRSAVYAFIRGPFRSLATCAIQPPEWHRHKVLTEVPRASSIISMQCVATSPERGNYVAKNALPRQNPCDKTPTRRQHPCPGRAGARRECVGAGPTDEAAEWNLRLSPTQCDFCRSCDNSPARADKVRVLGASVRAAYIINTRNSWSGSMDNHLRLVWEAI